METGPGIGLPKVAQGSIRWWSVGALRVMLVALLFLAGGLPAKAQVYPYRPVRIVVGTAPGGAPDVFARLIAQYMSARWGSVLVENRVGAAGNVAAELVAKSTPDGYTLYICDSTIWGINPHLYSKVPYDPLADFIGITTIADLPMFLTLHPSVPATNYAEFIAYAKAHPGKLAYSSAGNGSIHHITTELFKSMAGVDLVHVPYKGMGPGGQALIAGEVQVAFSSYTAIAPSVNAGKLRMLAITTARRSQGIPDLPTLAELGLAGFDMSSLLGALAPSGTPREIVAKLNSVMVEALASPEIRSRLTGFGVNVRSSSPEAFDALIREELVKYDRLVRLSGARMD
jgi:tripartite-type tricarboxylate transporter receptor subunit TctC